MQPDPGCTVIMTQTVRAADLPAYRRKYYPLFIDDNEPQIGLDGVPANFARKVGDIHDHIRTGVGRQQISVDFLDGTPGRVFDPEDDVVAHFIILGADLLDAGQ